MRFHGADCTVFGRWLQFKKRREARSSPRGFGIGWFGSFFMRELLQRKSRDERSGDRALDDASDKHMRCRLKTSALRQEYDHSESQAIEQAIHHPVPETRRLQRETDQQCDQQTFDRRGKENLRLKGLFFGEKNARAENCVNAAANDQNLCKVHRFIVA